MIDQLRWRFVGASATIGDLIIEGIDVSDLRPKPTGQTVRYRTARYPLHRYDFDVYEMEVGGRRHRFAATELSAGVFGHLVPRWRSAQSPHASL